MKKIVYISFLFLIIFLFLISATAKTTLESDVYDLTKDYIYVEIMLV